MMHDHRVKMCTVEANSIEEGLLNMYLAFEAAEGVGNTNMVSTCPAQSAHLLFVNFYCYCYYYFYFYCYYSY